ncbi:hypothetical protein GL218_00666 [Daldinia childiae]|uniref:uncharacterized protein n=1 Tax=Daldinia childiae TaxID=326645 RepID=UPI00144697A9|nr:uncharacterized protein GL218_00666 [Daldinia childiae]KAF3070433.1 hypothetical protein GL218_00666 [Daldinia childiae]
MTSPSVRESTGCARPTLLSHPCPKAPFGTVIVNHTANSGLGELVCTGANSRSATGNPTLHGEIAAINNCTQILTDPRPLQTITQRGTRRLRRLIAIHQRRELPDVRICGAIRRVQGVRVRYIDRHARGAWLGPDPDPVRGGIPAIVRTTEFKCSDR